MKIQEKIYGDKEQLLQEGPITIAFLGDSITHGAFASDDLDYEAVYWNLLRKRILEIRDYIPINVINAGISATTAKHALSRLDKQVLRYEPDLIVICFGLNDVFLELEESISTLRTIFEKCKDRDVIFMTPNMLNTYVASDTEPSLTEYAKRTAECQNSGRFDLYIDSVIKLAEEMQITVCDCYSKWKKLSETQDTTMLLANRINHPSKEMHKLFSDSLFEVIFGDTPARDTKKDSTMFDRNC